MPSDKDKNKKSSSKSKSSSKTKTKKGRSNKPNNGNKQKTKNTNPSELEKLQELEPDNNYKNGGVGHSAITSFAKMYDSANHYTESITDIARNGYADLIKDDKNYLLDSVGFEAKPININFGRIADVLDSNSIMGFPKTGNLINRYNKFNRYGYIDLYSRDSVLKEFLFFTKPDLNIFADNQNNLHENLRNIPFFFDASKRNTAALWQLQTTNCPEEFNGPFMNILSNSVTSKLDLPDISSESNSTTANIMGAEISIRSNSFKSDNGFDFSLSFNDTAYLEIYNMVKAYDEYMRLLQTGEHHPFKKYILSNTLSDQFSVYKFLVGGDGETILYYGKATGIYFTSVPRTDMNDPTDLGKMSISFKGHFPEDSNPMILQDFNRLVAKYIINKTAAYAKIYDSQLCTVDNSWAYMPFIEKVRDSRSMRRAPYGSDGTHFDYRLKWVADIDHINYYNSHQVIRG